MDYLMRVIAMQNRLFINELQSVSPEKVAKLEFKKGLNIITGASNTGKSYVINCIDYLFGAENPPKDINESKNYSFLLLELEYNSQPFTIKRYCPICNNNIDNQEENFNKIFASCEKENEKIKIKINDLKQTIQDDKSNIEKYNEEINELNNKIYDLTVEIDNELKPHSKVLKNRIDNILALQKKVELKIKLRNDITNYTAYRQECQNRLDTYKVNNESPIIDNKYYANFAKTIKIFLDNWKYKDNCNVIFDSNTYDIEIDGKPRGHLGKGHRALTHAAFSVGLQNYMYNNDFSFPAFIILDSPLLSLKEADYDVEKLSNTIQDAFWKDLSSTNKDRQIIIFDNKEPNEEIKKVSNYIKFTGNKHYGRCGFYE